MAQNESTSEQSAGSENQGPHYKQSQRRPSDQRENAFNLLAWLADGATGLIEELRHNDLGLPEQFWVHAEAARHETLLALRALVDDTIARTEQEAKQEEERQSRRQRRGGIDVQF